MESFSPKPDKFLKQKKSASEIATQSSSVKNKILLSVLAAIFTANMMIFNIPVFLPLFVEDQNVNEW
jgi:riboflavin transporter FmnP